MCIDLINTRNEAKLLQDSDDCPIKENGRKIGIMVLTMKFWNQKGHEDLGKSAQDLRDKLAYLKRACKLDTAFTMNCQNKDKTMDKIWIVSTGKSIRI